MTGPTVTAGQPDWIEGKSVQCSWCRKSVLRTSIRQHLRQCIYSPQARRCGSCAHRPRYEKLCDPVASRYFSSDTLAPGWDNVMGLVQRQPEMTEGPSYYLYPAPFGCPGYEPSI